MALVTNLIRVLPVTLIRRKITNRFLRSFLYYVPYVTLAVMTVPNILTATSNMLAGGVALVSGVVAAWRGANLFVVALICCTVVFVLDLCV